MFDFKIFFKIHEKPKRILTEDPLFGNLKTLIFEHFSEM